MSYVYSIHTTEDGIRIPYAGLSWQDYEQAWLHPADLTLYRTGEGGVVEKWYPNRSAEIPEDFYKAGEWVVIPQDTREARTEKWEAIRDRCMGLLQTP